MKTKNPKNPDNKLLVKKLISATEKNSLFQPDLIIPLGSTTTLKIWKGFQLSTVRNPEGKVIYFYGKKIKQKEDKKCLTKKN